MVYVMRILFLLFVYLMVVNAQRICQPGWLYVSGNCWYYEATKTNWDQAKAACEAQQSTLAIITDEAENRFLYSMIQKYGLSPQQPGTGSLSYGTNTQYSRLLARNPRLINALQLSQDVVSDTSCFKKHVGAALLGYAEAVVPVDGADECLHECLNSLQTYFFKCNSVMFYEITGECILNVKTRLTDPEFFTKDTGGERVDYYDNDCGKPGSRSSNNNNAAATDNRETRQADPFNCYEAIPGMVIAGFAEEVLDNINERDCLVACQDWTDPTGQPCRSIAYFADSQQCIINTITKDTEPTLFTDDQDAIYYEKLASCNTDPGPGPVPIRTTTRSPFPITTTRRSTTPGMCDQVVDLIFVVDGSGSIGAADFQNIRTFLRMMVDGFEIGPDRTQIGLVQFTEYPYTEFHLGSYQTREQILGAIDRIGWRNGHTNIGAALQHVHQKELIYQAGDRANVQNIVIVVTDGLSQDNPRAAAEALMIGGTVNYAVGVTDAVHDKQLLTIAGLPDRVYKVRDFSRLDQRLHDAIMAQICNNRQTANAGEGVWIGLSKTNNPNSFTWVDGSRLTYTNWKFGQPDDLPPGVEDCVVSEFEPLQRWSDTRCSVLHPYVCTRPPSDSLRNRVLLAKHRDAVQHRAPPVFTSFSRQQAPQWLNHQHQSPQFPQFPQSRTLQFRPQFG